MESKNKIKKWDVFNQSRLTLSIFSSTILLAISASYTNVSAQMSAIPKVQQVIQSTLVIVKDGKPINTDSAKANNLAGTEKVKDVGQVQTAQSATPALSQVTTLADKEIEARVAGVYGTLMAGATQYSLTSNLSLFTVSGVSYTQHDGFRISSAFGQSQGPSFSILSYGVTSGARFDASSYLGLQSNVLTVGGFGNYTRSQIKVDATDYGLHMGLEDTKASLDTISGGAYALASLGPIYVLGIGAYSSGSPSFSNDSHLTHANIDGYAASGAVGTVVPIGSGINADLRGSFNYTSGTTDSFVTSSFLKISQGRGEDINAGVSAKLFAVEKINDFTLRPFIQGGVVQRFSYTNEIAVNEMLYRFSEDPTILTGRIGVDIDKTDKFQSYIALKGDLSSDRTTIGGQVGLTLKLD